MAEIVGTGRYPQMATVCEGAFPAPALKTAGEKTVGRIPPFRGEIPVEVVRREARPREMMEDARVLIVGGGRAGFARLRLLADRIGCPLGATRAAVNAGYASYDMQIGLTGKSAAPEFYLAFGISGAVQHMAGIRGAKYVAAVNTDRGAPIFDYADHGIVADCGDVVERLLPELSRKERGFK